MDSNQQLRALFSTLVIIRNHSSFAALCQSKRAIDLIKVVVRICGEAVEKAEQLNAIYKGKQTTDIEPNSNDNDVDNHNKANIKKVFLVHRCTSNHYHDDAPEDLILLLNQISDVWCKMTSLVSSSLLLSSSSELAVVFKYCMRLLELDLDSSSSGSINDVEVAIRQACGKWYLYFDSLLIIILTLFLVPSP